MLPDPESSPEGVPRAPVPRERGMSADPVESPATAASPTQIHITNVTQRTPCACPCLPHGPRSITSPTCGTSRCPGGVHPEEASTGEGRRSSHSECGRTCALVIEKAVEVQEERRNEGTNAGRSAGVCGAVEETEKPLPVEGHTEPLIELLRAERQEPIITSFFLQLLTDGDAVPGDSGVSLDDKPEWADMEKIRLGQQFAQKYFFGLVFSEMLSLFLLFSSSGSLQPLIFSGNSDTPFKAFKRYLSTVTRVASWYNGDLWTDGEARQHLRNVRRLHDIYRRRLNSLRAAPSEEVQRVTRLHTPMWTEGAADSIRADFELAAAACPFVDLQLGRVEWINQMEMSITQMGFVGLAATYPERFGAGGASHEELEGFVHLWRVLGYLLGVEDRFNFCSAGLDGVRQRTRFLLTKVFPNNLSRVGSDWEHMTRCVLAGINHYVQGISYDVSLMYLLETVGLDAPHVRSQMSAREHRLYSIVSFVLRWVMRVPPLRAFLNWSLRRNIKRAQNASPEWLREREQRVYDYELGPSSGAH